MELTIKVKKDENMVKQVLIVGVKDVYLKIGEIEVILTLKTNILIQVATQMKEGEKNDNNNL